ncbi:MAG: pirin family protein [Clostridia bacterium]|nr:pirin family protein [Clostridia bacterium]
MERKIKKMVQGFATQDGAGVHLVRVLGNATVEDYDPILMLDSFDSTHPDDYTAGFPMHPHRGIETISYVVRGAMQHRDSLGNADTISDGEVQWMTAGSGILHEERIPAAEHLLGVQLWLNLPAKDKMIPPAYHSIRSADIPEVPFDGGKLRVLAGSYREVHGYAAPHLPLDYYDVRLDADAQLLLETDPARAVMLFTLQGKITVAGTTIPEKTAARLTAGEHVVLQGGSEPARVLFISSEALDEPVAWGGPIVMNTRAQLSKAFEELEAGTFLKNNITYE